MNTTTATTATPPSLEPGAESVATFTALLAAQGLAYFISWQWVGWRRHGILGVTKAGGPYDLLPTIDREEFARSNTSWSARDRLIGRVRTGSPKHRAVQALTARLYARLLAAAQP